MQRNCIACGRSFEASRPHAKFCGGTCGKRAQRGAPELSQVRAPIAATGSGGDLVAAITAELTAAGREGSFLGVTAIVLARQMSGPVFSGASYSALSKELRAVMAAALRDVPAASDQVDELKARRNAKCAATAGWR